MLDQSGFSRTGVADDADDLATLEGQVHIVHRCFLKRGSLSVYVGQVLRLDYQIPFFLSLGFAAGNASNQSQNAFLPPPGRLSRRL